MTIVWPFAKTITSPRDDDNAASRGLSAQDRSPGFEITELFFGCDSERKRGIFIEMNRDRGLGLNVRSEIVID
jgi:hypothetical protein